MALLELNPELEGLRRRLELKDERPWPLRSSMLLAAFAARLIARQPALHDAMEHLDHFLVGGLARNLEQERFGKNAVLDALLPQRVGNIAQRQSFGYRGPRSPNLLGDVLVRILKLRAQAVQTVSFFERRQVFPLNILDQSDFKRFRVVGGLFGARHFAQSRGARRVVAALARDDMEAVFARDVAHQQRLQHALLLNRLGELSQVTQRFAWLVGVWADLVHANHAPDRRAAVPVHPFPIIPIIPHLHLADYP